MKSWLWLVFLLLVEVAYAQKKQYTLADMPFEVDSITGYVAYRGVVRAPGIPADQLYDKARTVLQNIFFKDNQVLLKEDRANGIVAGKGRLFLSANTTRTGSTDWQAYYEVPVEIRVQDGQYSYLINNIELVDKGVKSSLNTEMSKALSSVRQTALSQDDYFRARRSVRPFTNLIYDLKRGMKIRSKGFFDRLLHH